MRRIDADRLAAHLADWQRRLAEHGECGGCAAELIGQVARVVDGWPEADGNPSGHMRADSGEAAIPPTRLRRATSLCTREALENAAGRANLHRGGMGCERMRTDTQPPRREDADAQGCVLAWDAHGSGWVVRHYNNLQGARWWMPLPGAPE